MQAFHLHDAISVFCSDGSSCMCGSCSELNLRATLGVGEKKPEKGREAAAPSNIKEIQEIQGGQEAPLDGDAINPKDA